MLKEMTMTRTMPLLLSILMVQSMALGEDIASTKPPLPDGAYPEWSMAKAWRVASPTRESICINGLWRFHSALPKAAFEEQFELPELSAWSTIKAFASQGDWKVALDKEIKKSGSGALRLDFSLKPVKGKDRTQIYRKINLEPDTYYTLSADLRGVFADDPATKEAKPERGMDDQGSNSGKGGRGICLMVQEGEQWSTEKPLIKSNILPANNEWGKAQIKFQTGKDIRAIRVYLCTTDQDMKPLQGKLWMDNLSVSSSSQTSPPEKLDWGYVKVPESWNPTAYMNVKDPARDKPKNEIDAAWYEREIVIPSNWEGRRISVSFDRVATDATLFCNGKQAGRAGYLGGEIEIGGLVKPGELVKLDVLVNVQNAPDAVGILAGRLKTLWNDPNYMFRWYYSMRDRGLLGDVFLKSEPPKQPRLGAFLIQTSVKNRQIKVRAELDNARKGPALELRCLVKDGARIVKEFSGQAPAGAAEAEIASPWTDPVLWELDAPKLYVMELELRGPSGLLDCSLPQQFGFREFEIRGKDFYLNNRKIHLFPADYLDPLISRVGLKTPESLERWLDTAKRDNRNFTYVENIEIPGGSGWLPSLLEIADRKGILLAPTPPQVNFFWDEFDRPEIRAEWERETARFVKRHWNHPSIALWRMNMNMDHYNQDQNPLLLDGSLVPAPETEKGRKAVVMAKSNAFVEKLDPTRKTYNHASANFSNIYSLNNYLNWPQPQDLREWLRIWAERGSKPLMMSEFDIPYVGSFGLNDQTSWGANEPLMTEYSAIMLGEESYKLEEEEFAEFCELAWDRKNGKWRSLLSYFVYAYPPLVDEVGSAYFKVVYPAWRTWGISGGMTAWDNRKLRLVKKSPGNINMRQSPPLIPVPRNDWGEAQKPGFNSDSLYLSSWPHDAFLPEHPLVKEYFGRPTKRGKLLPELLSPLYAYIAGPGRDWPAQDHAFYSGEKAAKSVVLINDLPRPAEFSVSWKAMMDGKPIASGNARKTVQPAENQQAEIEFAIPAVSEKREIVLAASVQAEGRELAVEPFSILAYPPRSKPGGDFSGWRICDPAGKTAAALRRIGCEPSPISGTEAPSGAKVLIFGAGALDDPAAMRLFSSSMANVKSGAQTLVFEQSAAALEKGLGLRCTARASRQAWLRDRQSPLAAGLENDELRDWRGATSLVPPGYMPKDADESQRYRGVWRCSSRGTVSSVLAEKPQLGTFRPILDCEFDLRYTPLWEVFEGRGRLLFCQLDVSDRMGADPSVDRLMSNMLRDAASWQPRTESLVSVVGQDEAALGDLASLNLNSVANPGACPPAAPGQILVLTRGCDAWLDAHAAELPAFQKGGGTILAAGLSGKAAARLAELGPSFEVESVKGLSINRLDHDVPAVFRGAGPAEVHWRERKDLDVVKSVPPGSWRSPTGVLAWIPSGKGGLAWTSALPSDFSPERRPDLVFTQANVRRLLALTLTNLGAASRLPWSEGLNAAPLGLPVSLERSWKAELDPSGQGEARGWQLPQFDDKAWRYVAVPGYFEDKVPEWAAYDGAVWYRTTFKLPESLRQTQMEFFAAAIDDFDEIYVNGVKIGATGNSTPKWWETPRRYPLDGKLLKFGDAPNSIAAKVTDTFKSGGFLGAVQIRAKESPSIHYLDKRAPRDDPYAYGRW